MTDNEVGLPRTPADEDDDKDAARLPGLNFLFRRRDGGIVTI